MPTVKEIADLANSIPRMNVGGLAAICELVRSDHWDDVVWLITTYRQQLTGELIHCAFKYTCYEHVGCFSEAIKSIRQGTTKLEDVFKLPWVKNK
jgi:hypothetical protein